MPHSDYQTKIDPTFKPTQLDTRPTSPYTIDMETTLYLIYIESIAMMLIFSMMMMEMEMQSRIRAARFR